MAFQTRLVTGACFAVLRRVAVVATERARGGAVRKTPVTILATRMPGERTRVAHLLRVTRLTDGLSGVVQAKCVRCMALRAGRASVERAFGARRLVTAAAIARFGVPGTLFGVRIVAADAASRLAIARVIGMYVLVAIRTRLLGSGAHRVR